MIDIIDSNNKNLDEKDHLDFGDQFLKIHPKSFWQSLSPKFELFPKISLALQRKSLKFGNKECQVTDLEPKILLENRIEQLKNKK